MEAGKREKDIHRLFILSVALKGCIAALQLILGLLLLFTDSVTGFILRLTESELFEDPNDFFATHIQSLLAPTHSAQIFGALYLLSHGAVKVFLVAGLLRNKFWAYPASIAVLGLFILYQVLRWLQTHSIALVVLTLFDCLVIWLIWHEYRQVLKRTMPT